MGYDDDDEPEYEDLLEPPPENAPSNYAEPPELPPFKKNKKKAKRSRWERYQVRHTSSLSFTPHTHTNTHHTASAYFDSLSLSLRGQNQPLHNYCVVDKEAIRSSGRSSSRSHFLG